MEKEGNSKKKVEAEDVENGEVEKKGKRGTENEKQKRFFKVQKKRLKGKDQKMKMRE